MSRNTLVDGDSSRVGGKIRAYGNADSTEVVTIVKCHECKANIGQVKPDETPGRWKASFHGEDRWFDGFFSHYDAYKWMLSCNHCCLDSAVKSVPSPPIRPA